MCKFKQPAQLHNHSKYSLLDAVPSSEEWVHWCIENDTPGFAVTDHGTSISMYDAIRFPDYIKSYNKKHGTDHPSDKVIGIPAVELYVKLNKEDRSHFHITVWATSNEGYFNLMKLSSLAYEDTVSFFGSVKARVTFDQILEYKEGLKFGTGCIAGPIGQAIMKDDNYALAEERFLMYRDMFGDDLYIEFHPTDVTHDFNRKTGGFDPIPATECACDGNQQKAYNNFLKDMVEKYGGKPIPVTDAHFIKPEDKVVQDCLLKNGNDNGWYFQESYHQKKSEEIFHFLRDQLGDGNWLTEEMFAQWIENTYEVMDAAKSIDISYDYHLPEIEIPDHIKAKTDDYEMQTYYLTMELCKKHGRWNDGEEYKERLKKEIGVIMKNDTLNFLPYFLLYEDISTYARSLGILQGIGRGSAGGCLLSYYLKIIHIDPIKEDLPFERFLSHARIRAGSFPDIDSDFGTRTEIIKYLQDKYGLGFAQIATFQKMKTKNAIKDSMWALYGFNREHPQVKAVCNTIPDSPQGVDEHDFLYGYTDKEDTYHMGQVEVNEHLANFFNQYPDVEKLVNQLIGVVRGWGRHASAYVISTVDLAGTRVPTMKMMDKKAGEMVTVTQYDAGMVESSGLVKADVLGVTTIEAVSQCMDLVKQNSDIDYLKEDDNGVAEIFRLPNSKDVYTDFYNKKTDSSFQFNTGLIKGYVQEFVPLSRRDLSDFTALCRPGALDAPVVNADLTEEDNVSAAQYYMDVRNGKRQLSHIHPDLEPYTTNGAFVYQEQVMAFLVDFAGYTLEESDRVRGAIAKKKHEVMLEAFTKIRAAAETRGWTDRQADTVCKQVEAFSRYSFNRSHSRCYAETGYITMYLKRHHKLEWWTSVLNTTKSEDKMRYFMTLLGDLIAPPSFKDPSMKFTISDGKIVAPLSALKGIGPKTIEELVDKGPFLDFDDFLERTDHRRVNVGHFGVLVASRAADDFVDKDLPYLEARHKMLDYYIEKRKTKKMKDILYTEDQLELFLMEKEANKCFNKTFLGNSAIVSMLTKKWSGLTDTGRSGVPLLMGTTPILRDINIAAGLVKKKHKDDVGMILLFQSSSYKKVKSKKTGKEYDMVKIILSDGFNDIECTQWNMNKALKWDKNSIVYVKGDLSEGWKSPVALTIKEMEKING